MTVPLVLTLSSTVELASGSGSQEIRSFAVRRGRRILYIPFTVSGSWSKSHAIVCGLGGRCITRFVGIIYEPGNECWRYAYLTTEVEQPNKRASSSTTNEIEGTHFVAPGSCLAGPLPNSDGTFQAYPRAQTLLLLNPDASVTFHDVLSTHHSNEQSA